MNLLSFEIEIPKDLNGSIEFLKTTPIIIIDKYALGPESQTDWAWIGLENPNEFKLVMNEFMPIKVWWAKCSLSYSPRRDSTILNISIRPGKFILFVLTAIIIGVLYAIITIAIGNYGTPGFYVSFIIPTLAFSLILFIWVQIFKIGARRFKKHLIYAIKSKFPDN